MSALGSWIRGIPWDAVTAPSPLGTDALEKNPPGLLNMQVSRHQDACLEDNGQSLVLIKCQLTS